MPQIEVFLADGFPALSLTLVSEPLRVANRELLDARFGVRLISERGGTVASSGLLSVPTEPIAETRPDVVLMLASYHPERSITQATLGWLRRRARGGALMGCVDTAALVFARAGLLDRHPAAAHAEAIHGFRRQFPEEFFLETLYDFAPPRCSSAGGVATMDMTLALIAQYADPALSRRVAAVLTHPAATPPPQAAMPARLDRHLAAAVETMQANLRDPLAISVIAARAGVPGWQLTRLFRRHLQATPSRYYLNLRLARARDMLRNSQLRVGEIAGDCGFENLESFSRAYRRRYGLPPSQDRALP
jgi:transcriptional regulator GlxA family with amidase domain